MQTEPQTDLERLQHENAELRKKLASFERAAAAQTGAARLSTQVAWYITAGPELNKALTAWLNTWVEEQRVDIEQSADVLAAIIRRIFKVGTVGVIMALLPTTLLMMQLYLMAQQNALIESQNTFFAEQNQKLERQVGAQEADVYVTRRTELVSTLNARRRCTEADPQRCAFAASDRDRNKAFTELLALERKHHAKIDLTDVTLANLEAQRPNLAGANLTEVNLRLATFHGARLDGANATGADLTQINLESARMEKAKLVGVDAQGANLAGANLARADLEGADLTGALLDRADLRGTNLTDADLKDTRLQKARYDGKTRWPDGFDPAARGAVNK